jgi:hypothetical protein
MLTGITPLLHASQNQGSVDDSESDESSDLSSSVSIP